MKRYIATTSGVDVDLHSSVSQIANGRDYSGLCIMRFYVLLPVFIIVWIIGSGFCFLMKVFCVSVKVCLDLIGGKGVFGRWLLVHDLNGSDW